MYKGLAWVSLGQTRQVSIRHRTAKFLQLKSRVTYWVRCL